MATLKKYTNAVGKTTYYCITSENRGLGIMLEPNPQFSTFTTSLMKDLTNEEYLALLGSKPEWFTKIKDTIYMIGPMFYCTESESHLVYILAIGVNKVSVISKDLI
jgi:hypothetical protein